MELSPRGRISLEQVIQNTALKAKLEKNRQSIDQLDEQLLELLCQRTVHAIEIGRIKKQLGLPIHDPEREELILNRLEKRACNPLTTHAVRAIFSEVIQQIRSIEAQTSTTQPNLQ